MADNETIADIIVEMRKLAHEFEDYGGVSIPAMLLDFSDRLEAALKRERAKIEADALEVGGIVEAAHRRELSKNASKNGADFGQLGDAAKLREALEHLLHGEYRDRCEVTNIAHSALAAPPRNCDRFATIDEARKAHEAICEKYGKCHNGCPLNNEEHYSAFDCFDAWLFAQAEGGTK